MKLQRIAALVVELVQLVTDEKAEKSAAAAAANEDMLVAELAAGMLGPEQLGDENAALAAVHSARLVLKHARRDVLALDMPAGKPS